MGYSISELKNHFSGFFSIAILLICSFPCLGQISSNSPGNWNNASTWQNAEIPSISSIVTVDHDSVVIPKGVTVEVSALNIANGKLVVNGTLIVYGNLKMIKNDAKFSMGPEAFVNIFGDFEAKNKIDISISSYLIIQGNFTKTGSSGQGNLDVENGNIYIFGEATGWPENFSGCEGDYDGETSNIAEDDCDFGNDEDFVDNHDDLPPEIVELLNCFNLTQLENLTVNCDGIAHFEIEEISEVTYQWQVKTYGSNWISIAGAVNNELSISNSDAEFDDGNQFRVVVKATEANSGTCKVVVSNVATLNINNDNKTWTGAINSDWNNTGNWSCNSVPNSTSNALIPGGLLNYPVINETASAEVKDLRIEPNASVLLNGEMEIYGNISSVGTFSAGAGTIYFTGNSIQNIPGDVFFENRINNLHVGNPQNVILEGSLNITGILRIEEGNLETNDYLSLLSTASQTALIDGSGNGEIIGNIKMQRYLDPAFGYKYFSSPFKQTLVGNFADYIDLNSAFPNFYSYNENRKDEDGKDATGWEIFTSAENELEILRGYALNFGAENAAKTVEISGEVNNGPLSINLKNNGGKYTQGFHLIGNPYPSPIDWNSQAGWTKANIDNAIYFFTASNSDQYSGTYSSYVNGISSEDGKSSNIIPSMQGFFVHVSDPVSGIFPISATLGINNQARLNNFSQEFMKSRKSKKVEIPLFSLSAGFKNEKNDASVFYFPSFASTSFEKEKDALKIMNTEVSVPNLYSLSPKADKLSINALPVPNANTKIHIPLGINSQKEGWMDLNLKKIQNIGFYIYLIDNERKKFQDLSQDSDYSFYSTAGENNSRFELLLTYSKMANPEEIFPEVFSINTIDKNIGIKMNLEEGKSGLLQLANLSGQILEQLQVKEKEVHEFKGIKSSGIYLVSLHYEKGVFTKKIIIQN